MNSEELIQKMYAAIHNVVAPTDPGSKAHQTSIFTMMAQGLSIVPEDFDPETSPANRNRLVDVIPHVQKDYVAGNKVSDVYAQILTSQFPPDQEPTQQEAEELKEAEEYIDAQLDSYLDGMLNYSDARSQYWSAVNAKDPNTSVLKSRMDAALLKWKVAGHKEKYESCLAVQHQFYAKTPSRLVEAASKAFEDADSGNGYEAAFVPQNWQDPQCPLSWAEVTVNESSKAVSVHEDIKNTADNFKVRFPVGFWSASDSSQYKETVKQLNQQMTAGTVTLRMKIARVEIYRDWLNTALMNYTTSSIPGIPAGRISNGTLNNTEGLSMPILPTELVLAKDIDVYCQFSDEERSFLNKIKDESSDQGVSFLWFQLGKGHSEYHEDVTDQEQKQYQCNAKLSLGQKPMILGFVNSVLPYYASLDGTGVQLASPTVFCRATQPQFLDLRGKE